MGGCCDTELQEERLPIIVLRPDNPIYDAAHRCRVVDVQPVGVVVKSDNYEARMNPLDAREFFIPRTRMKIDAPNWTVQLGDGVFVVD